MISALNAPSVTEEALPTTFMEFDTTSEPAENPGIASFAADAFSKLSLNCTALPLPKEDEREYALFINTRFSI
jgi:hypothetical protein